MYLLSLFICTSFSYLYFHRFYLWNCAHTGRIGQASGVSSTVNTAAAPPPPTAAASGAPMPATAAATQAQAQAQAQARMASQLRRSFSDPMFPAGAATPATQSTISVTATSSQVSVGGGGIPQSSSKDFKAGPIGNKPYPYGKDPSLLESDFDIIEVLCDFIINTIFC